MVGAWCFDCLSGPPGVYLLDFFYPGLQFYLLLSPYLCLISFLYLDFLQKQTQDRKNIKDPQKKYRLGTVSKIFQTGLTVHQPHP